VALLIGAGLLMRSAFPMARTAGDAETGDTLIVELELTGSEYGGAARRLAYFETLLERIASIPGTEAESLSSPGTWLAVGPEALAIADCGHCGRGGVYLPLSPAFARHHAVSPGFFAAHGLDVVEGRGFTAADRLGAPRVAIVNRTFAIEHFERSEPLGRGVQVGGLQGPWYTVVGIVEDVPGLTMGSARRSPPVLYLPLFQQPPRSVDLSVRTAGDLHGDTILAGSSVTSAASELDGSVEVVGVASARERLEHQSAPLRWLGLLFGVTGGLATLLAVHGLYSVMRYNVLLRRREIGIRLAVGAAPRAVVGMVLRRSLLLVALGGGRAVGCAAVDRLAEDASARRSSAGSAALRWGGAASGSGGLGRRSRSGPRRRPPRSGRHASRRLTCSPRDRTVLTTPSGRSRPTATEREAGSNSSAEKMDRAPVGRMCCHPNSTAALPVFGRTRSPTPRPAL
jgi:putative ABC transport system permease protein